METETKKVPQTKIEIKVAKDPNQRPGLRGLKGLVFGEFKKAYLETKDNKDGIILPTMDQMTKLVGEKFPQSRWMARPKVHYGYYKSKFISALKEGTLE